MNSKVTKDIHKAVNSLLGLKKSRVSFHLVVHVGGKTKSFGTKSACEKFEEYRDAFERALLLDVVSMCNPEPGDDQIVSNVDNIAPKLKSKYHKVEYVGPRVRTVACNIVANDLLKTA